MMWSRADGVARTRTTPGQRFSAEQALRESLARHRLLVKASPEAIVAFDARLVIRAFNPAAQALLAWPAKTMVGRPLRDLVPASLQQSCGQWLRRQSGSHAPANAVARLELAALCGDGRELPVDATVARSGRGERTEFTAFVRPRGLRGQDQAGAAGDASREQIARLNTELEDRVRQRTEQLEAAHAQLESFAYAVAHDLRSPLITIDGFSRMLETQCAAAIGEPGLHYLARIRGGIRQMSVLTDATLTLAHLSRVELRAQEVDLAVLARATLARLQGAQPQRVLVADIPQRLPARGDARLLAEAVDHLVGNAWKFSARKPQTRIALGLRAGGGEPVYYVADQGAGFDMAHASHLFGAFQRLHPAGEFDGAGVGLALVQQIVARHGGRIWAEAAPQQGATFFFTLPRAA